MTSQSNILKSSLLSLSSRAAQSADPCGAAADGLPPVAAPKIPAVHLLASAALFLCFATLLVSVACSNDTKAAPTKQEIVVDPNLMIVDHPELFQTVKVENRDLPTVLNANGTIQPDVNKTIHVTSLGSGRVVELKVRLGDHVNKGQVLLVISSPDLAGALGDYQKASADEALARARNDATRRLQQAGQERDRVLNVARASAAERVTSARARPPTLWSQSATTSTARIIRTLIL